MSILNIDPETGHVYVEDDASYRTKTYGTVYRLDQKGKILKTWDPFFFDIEESKLISPWGDINRATRSSLSRRTLVHRFHIRQRRQDLSVETQ